MNAPHWMNEMLREFGHAAGIEHFGFNDRDVAALRFEQGAMLVFEYAYTSLTVMITVPVANDVETAKRVLAHAIPERRGDFRIKTGFLAQPERAFFAIRLPHDEVTLPILNAAFLALRRIADQFGEGTQ